uniref:Transposase n=1 Tax=Heterorhabditis bacteriophora TaxID=37862 RepID=A0A1I7WB66_HETBA
MEDILNHDQTQAAQTREQVNDVIRVLLITTVITVPHQSLYYFLKALTNMKAGHFPGFKESGVPGCHL